MSRIRLHHHVYSSLQGYRTLRASPEVPAPTVKVLEDFSEKVHSRARRAPRFSVFPPDEIFLCVSMNVQSGTDHVGRTRSLVHNVLIRKEEVREIPGFNHLGLPHAAFLKPGGDLQRDLTALPADVEVPAEDTTPLAPRFDRENLPRKSVLHLLRALLGDKPVLLRSDKEAGWDRVVQVSALLPPAVREPLAVVNGAYVPEFADLGHPTVFLVPADVDIADVVREGKVALDEGGMLAYNLPLSHPWEQFVVGNITSGDSHGDLATLLRVVQRYRPLARYSPQDFKDLVEAFQAARQCFDPDGRVNVRRAPADGLTAAPRFFQAGHPDIAFDIFQDCLRLLGARKLLDPVRDFMRTIEEGAKILAPLFAEARESPVDELVDLEQ
jgi:hypothetical protein